MISEHEHEHEVYRVLPGPEAFLPPAAAMKGVVLPDPGQAHIEGRIVPEEEALEHIARKLLGAKVPTLHPGPLVLWHWNEKAAKKAAAIKALADAVPARIIPMADYRPKYPKINPEVEINPNHPNLTIWHNKEDVCVFVGVHCHQANLSLKIIRGGTSCYTIALCAQAGHEDAMCSLRDISPETLWKLVEWVKKLKAGGMKSQGLPFTQFSFKRSGNGVVHKDGHAAA
ncbi:MAG: carbon monoxide dehydrogenase beta subunit family protein [Nitrospirota bacterium]